MSEKKLRDYVRQSIANHESGPGARVTEKMLADPPDVVKVLRWIASDSWDTSRGRPREPHEIASFIVDTFHIRLTETGWEWTDDTS